MGARARWVALGVVLLLLAALGWVAVSWTSGGTSELESSPTPPERSECPDEMTTTESGVTVPRGGTADPGRLVPDGSPVAVTVCRYATDDPSGSEALPLEGDQELSGDVERVVDQLREVPLRSEQTSCMMRSPRTPYLLVVDYEETSAWIASEYTDECDYASRYTTNGEAVYEPVGEELHEAYSSGRWPAG